MKENEVKYLMQLYKENSKHSNYQKVCNRLDNIIGANINVQINRYEQERLDYIKKNLIINEKKIRDIGGNTGFFTFEMLELGARHVEYIEGNKHHSMFVQKVSELLSLNGKISIDNNYYSFTSSSTRSLVNTCLLLNVLHHVGDDYDNSKATIENAKSAILHSLRLLSESCEILVFQLGYNWKGDIKLPLFKDGTKKEMIDFIKTGISGIWNIKAIGVAENVKGVVEYNDLNNKNIERDDQLGEFLNRPIFILERYEK